MKKSKIILLVLLVLTFAGCGKKPTKMQNFCSNLEPHLTAFSSDTSKFDDFVTNTKDIYVEYCTGEESDVCSNVKFVHEMAERNYDMYDCDALDSIDMTKDECENHNMNVQGMINRKPIEEVAYVNAIKLSCDALNVEEK